MLLYLAWLFISDYYIGPETGKRLRRLSLFWVGLLHSGRGLGEGVKEAKKES